MNCSFVIITLMMNISFITLVQQKIPKSSEYEPYAEFKFYLNIIYGITIISIISHECYLNANNLGRYLGKRISVLWKIFKMLKN